MPAGRPKSAATLLREEIENRFSFHPADESTGPQHDAVRADVKRLALKWAKELPDGRHKAEALTALQNAMFWANAAVACDSGRDTGHDGVLANVSEAAIKRPEKRTTAESKKQAKKAAASPAQAPVKEAAKSPRRVTRRARTSD